MTETRQERERTSRECPERHEDWSYEEWIFWGLQSWREETEYRRNIQIENLFDLWMKEFHRWRSETEQTHLTSLLYGWLSERKLFGGPFTLFDIEDCSFWFSPGGLCNLIEVLADRENISPEQFIESLFRKESAEEIFRMLVPRGNIS